MKIRESIIVMNSKTWELFRENALETASLQDNPLKHIEEFSDLDVIIDESVPNNITETWYRENYELHKRLKNKKEEGE